MKRTLQVLSAALLLTVASVTAQAQGGGGGGGGGGGMGRGGGQKTALLKDITLTADQTTKIDTLFAQAQVKTTALGIARGTPATPEQTKARTDITNERNAAIKKILTTEQNVVFDKNMADMAAMGRGRGN